MKHLLIFTPLLIQLQGCNSANADSPVVPFPKEIIHESEYNEYAATTSKGTLLLRSQTSYESELLNRSSEAAINVNFEVESILLVDMGSQGSGGYSIKTQFTQHDKYLKADITYIFPGDGCVVNGAITNPYKFIKIEYTNFIVVNESIEYTQC